MTAAELLVEVRETLGDQRKTKYTDATLVNLYNEGIRDIVKISNIFRQSISILIENNVSTYTLPENVYFLTRVTQDSTVIPFYSFEEMDNIESGWEETVGNDTVKAIVYDQQNMNQITVYPELESISDTYFKLPDGTSVEIDSGDAGTITYLEGAADDYTVVVDEDDADYGALVSIEYDWYPVKIHYVKKPDVVLVSDTTVDVELDDIHAATLKYYIAGTVLFNDDKIENVQKGTVLLQKYRDEVTEMREKSTKNFHRVARKTTYRTPFN